MHDLPTLAGTNLAQVVIAVRGNDGAICFHKYMHAFSPGQIQAAMSVVFNLPPADDADSQSTRMNTSAKLQNRLNKIFSDTPLLHPHSSMGRDEVVMGILKNYSGLHGGVSCGVMPYQCELRARSEIGENCCKVKQLVRAATL